MVGWIDAGQRARESVKRIGVADQHDFTGDAHFRAQPIAGPESSAGKRFQGDGHLVFAADPRPAAPSAELYNWFHE